MQQAVKAQAAAARATATQLKAHEQQLESAMASDPLNKQARDLADIDRAREAARKFQAKSDAAARTIQMLKSQDVPASDPRMKVAIAERDALADAASATRSVADSTVSRLLSGTEEQLKQLAVIDRAREAARKFQAKSDAAAFTIQVLQAQNVPASDPRMKVAIAERDALADAASATRSAAAGLTDSMVSNSIDKTKVDELNAVRAAIDKLESIAANGSDSE